MSTDKIERVIVLAERLIVALDDIAALEQGKPQAMKTTDPEIQKLAALYAREAGTLTAAIAQAAPNDLRSKLSKTTARFRETLQRQIRILTRVRNASEGVIHAIADEVGRRRTQMRPYGRTPATTPRPTGAMVYNSVA